MARVRVLGISAFYHDSAAALIEDGSILAAAQEERFTRKKYDASFPKNAIGYCLETCGADLDAVDHVCFFEKPFIKFERLLETYLACAPKGIHSFRLAVPLWIKEKLFQKTNLIAALKPFSTSGDVAHKLLFAEHHQSHAASAFFPSPFDQAVVLTLDGVGEWATASVSIGKGNTLKLEREIHWPHSLGLLYSAFTYYLGFKVNSGEYKVMGLAPYGEPRYAELILDKLIDVKEDGSFWLNLNYFNYATGLTMTSTNFHDLFGGPPRDPSAPLTEREMDLAASVQKVTEEVVIRIARDIARSYRLPNLCLAGGVALNCVANGKILRERLFENIWIQPAAGDAGGSLGAALAAYHLHLGQPRKRNTGMDAMQGALLGPEFSDAQVQSRLKAIGAVFTTHDEEILLEKTVTALERGDTVGWFSGRMEFGPRALGARSILADARNPEMQKTLNLRIKQRESFRPFAPAVLADDVQNYFELDGPSQYMLLVADIKRNLRHQINQDQAKLFGIDKLNVSRSDIPAVTHVDYSARVQTVHRETNQRFHALLEVFRRRTGCSVLVNTSFNVRGEPIVCTPEDAFRCFMATQLDCLVIENCFLTKGQQNVSLSLGPQTFEAD